MRNRRFMLYLLGIFISTIILIVFLQYSSNEHINKLIQGNESLITEFKIIGETQKLQTDILYIESEIHRAVIGEDSGYLEGIQNREKNARAELFRIKNLVLTDSTKGLVLRLDSLIEEKLKFGNKVLDALFIKGRSAADELYKSREGKSTMGEIVNVIDSLNGPRREYLTRLTIDADKSGHRARLWGTFLAIIAGLACLLTFLYISRRFKRQQQLLDQLNESEKKVREAGIMKENFMANMSHEIRTPMNAILGFTNLLQKEPLNEKSQEFINSIRNSGENLLSIINDVLDFSKIEAGMMRIESNPFSLRGLLDSIETMFAARVQSKNLQFKVNVEEPIPDLLKGDAVRLTQILVNLVNNSVKFTNSGGIFINVAPDKQTEDGIEVSFSVKDTGIGISTDKINTIFERFQQADEETTRKYGGTGLGLSIVKQLVELQNGSIRVISVPNMGTEFLFAIPYALPETIAEKNKLELKPVSEIQLNKGNIKILVAEDNTMNQSLMKHLLTDWKLDFHIVNNGKEAIETLRQKEYSLVLMDIQMPEMDGYSTTLKIRNELNSNIPIVAMTAHAMAGEREKCLSFGMNEYISKPIRENELYKIVNNLLRSSEKKEPENQVNHDSDDIVNNFEVINLGYLKELSGGNKAFEVKMISQFLEQLPGELAAMENEFGNGNYMEVAKAAHNMKTSVSFLGLLEKLGDPLDYIESSAVDQKQNVNLKEKIAEIKAIHQKARQEAERYLKIIS
ncbi:MAG TPA: ATP-binding protein [Flavitalea sp.]|nr:ATP-binding protein [Flavitalea sp.]